MDFLRVRLSGVADANFSTTPAGSKLTGIVCSWAVSRASATWIESWQAMLRSPCLPYGDRCLQHLDYISISDGFLQGRGLEVTQQFQRERFQILDGLKPHFCRIRRRVKKGFQIRPAQRPAPLFFFRPEANRARSGEDARPHRQQL